MITRVSPKLPAERGGTRGKSKLISGENPEGFALIDDTVRNVSEGLGHYHTSVDRVCHSVETGDYFGTNANLQHSKPCYRLQKTVSWKKVRALKEKSADQSSLGPLLDQLNLINPDFVKIQEISELAGEKSVHIRDQAAIRPPRESIWGV